jgi:hypothetical protein
MPPRLVVVHGPDPEGLAPSPGGLREPGAAAREPDPEPNAFPGASRRDWVYREISQLGLDPLPPVERDP